MAADWTHRSFAILCGAMLIFLMVATVEAVSGPNPIIVDWSRNVYGPDGPWHALNVSFGNPPQFVDVLFSHLRVSWPLAPRDCAPHEPCQSKAAGYYNYRKSSSFALQNKTVQYLVEGIEFTPGGAFWRPSVHINATTTPLSDTVRIYSNGIEYEANDCGIEPFSDAVATIVSSDIPYAVTLGGLSIGTTFDRMNVPGTNWPRNEMISFLYKSGTIPSNSFSFTPGSPSVGIKPRLVLGGYDSSRVVGRVLRERIPDNAHFNLNLTKVGLGTDHADSPFPHGNQDGLLLDQDGPIKYGAATGLNFGAAYITLPFQTCEALAKHLPIKWKHSYGVYFWDTEDPLYHKIFSSRAFLYFEFLNMQGFGYYSAEDSVRVPVQIRIPMRLLKLTLEAPIVSGPSVPYFPCAASPVDDAQFQLGRAFLQAAMVGINWATFDGGISTMYLTQAAGPVVNASSIQYVLPNQTTIPPATGLSSFSNSWEGHWNEFKAPQLTPQPPPAGHASNPGPEPQSPKSSLSIGADVGIAIGSAATLILAAALIACLFARSRRRKAAIKVQEMKSLNMSSPDPSTSNETTSPDVSHVELEHIPVKIYELPGEYHQPEELESPVSPLTPNFDLPPLGGALRPPSYTAEQEVVTPLSNNSQPSEMEVPRAVEKSGFLVC